jgi:hypothetical protein
MFWAMPDLLGGGGHLEEVECCARREGHMNLPPSTTLRLMRALPETSKSVGSNSKFKQHLIQVF